MVFRRFARRRFGRRRVGRRTRRVGFRGGMRKRGGMKMRGARVPRRWRANAWRASCMVSQGRNLYPEIYKTKLIQSFTYDPALQTGALNVSTPTIWAGNFIKTPNVKASAPGTGNTSTDSPNGTFLLLGSLDAVQKNSGAYRYVNVYASKIVATVFWNATSGGVFNWGMALVPSSIVDPLAGINAMDFKENPNVMTRLSEYGVETSKKVVLSRFMTNKRMFPFLPASVTDYNNVYVSGEPWYWNLYFYVPNPALTFPGAVLTVHIDMTYYCKFFNRNNTPLGTTPT